MMITPSREYLQKHFTYDPQTGEFVKVLNGVKGINQKGYLGINVHNQDRPGNTRYLVHRLIWKYMTGEEPNIIDHINGNGLDNRWDNLRNVNTKENNRNAKIPKSNKSGYIGVYSKRLRTPSGKYHLGKKRQEDRDRWSSSVVINGQLIKFGIFKCPTAAHFARVKYLQENHPNHFHPNHGRKQAISTL